MFKHRAIPIGLIGLLAVLVLMGGVTDFRALDRGHLGLVYPLDTHACGTALTGATLSCHIAAIEATRQTLMLPPGTWTINANLTVPSGVGLWVAEGAMFNISPGVTLTINGSLTAPMAPIISGAGNVVFGGKVSEISPYWFGAACDDTTDDAPALTRTFAAASASGRRVVRLPPATCRITREVTVPNGVGLEGDNWYSSVIRVVGAIRGLVYDSADTENPHVTFRQFTVRGDVATSLDLFTIRGGAWNVVLDRVRLRGTSQRALVLDEVPGLTVQNCEIGEFALSGIWTKGWTNGVTVEGCRFEDFGTANTEGTIRLDSAVATGNWQIRRNVFESNTKRTNTALVLNGVHTVTFEHNYVERYNGVLVKAGSTAANTNIVIRQNFLHSFNPFKISFPAGALAHDNIVIEDNSFGGVSALSNVFDPGSTRRYRFLGNSGDATPKTWVAGYPNTTTNVLKVPDLVVTGGLQVGDWNRGLLLKPGDNLEIANAVDLSKITLHVGGTDAAVLEETLASVPQNIKVPGQLWTGNTSAATRPGRVAAKLPIYDAAGRLIGYIPIYNRID